MDTNTIYQCGKAEADGRTDRRELMALSTGRPLSRSVSPSTQLPVLFAKTTKSPRKAQKGSDGNTRDIISIKNIPDQTMIDA